MLLQKGWCKKSNDAHRATIPARLEPCHHGPGVDISMFTDFPDEEEVLLLPGSMFEVLQTLSGALLGGVRCITLRQAWGWHHLDVGFVHAASASERLAASVELASAAAERCQELEARSERTEAKHATSEAQLCTDLRPAVTMRSAVTREAARLEGALASSNDLLLSETARLERGLSASTQKNQKLRSEVARQVC